MKQPLDPREHARLTAFIAVAAAAVIAAALAYAAYGPVTP